MKKDLKTKEYMKKLGSLKLSDSSRERIENNLLEYARFHGASEGVRVGNDGRSISQVPQRTSLFTSLFNPKLKPMTAAIIAIMLIAGGGTSYAAQGAVPGDALYPVKIEVNENVKSAFAIGNEAEARLHASLAEERLEEAEELATRGELTAEVATDISARLKQHYTEADERSSKVEAEGNYESSITVRSSLEGSFRAHADIITELNSSVSGNNGTSLITDLRGYADASAIAQTRATATVEASVSAKVVAESTIKRADNYLAEVQTKVARAEGKVSAEAHARAEAKLAQAVSAQAEAKASLKAEAYGEAYNSAQSAVRIASEVETMINSLIRLKIEIPVNSTGDRTIDIRTNSDNDADASLDSNTRTDGETDTNTDAEIEVRTDTNVNTDVLDLEVRGTSATKINSSLGN